jgi:hypothetical protein
VHSKTKKNRAEQNRTEQSSRIDWNILEQPARALCFPVLTRMSFAQEELLGKSKMVMFAIIPITWIDMEIDMERDRGSVQRGSWEEE